MNYFAFYSIVLTEKTFINFDFSMSNDDLFFLLWYDSVSHLIGANAGNTLAVSEIHIRKHSFVKWVCCHDMTFVHHCE